VCESLWCVACQASGCRAAKSADAQEFGSVMEMIHKIVVRRFGLVVSCDDTTEGCGMGSKWFSTMWNFLLYLN
jgi:hypothetical protein